MAKQRKQMRTSRPRLASRKRAAAATKTDQLKARLLELCDLAEASVARLRKLDLEGLGPKKFREACDGIMDAGYYVQGIEQALEARIKAEEAVRAMVLIDDDGGPNSWGMGLTKIMVDEARQKLSAVTA